MTQSLAVVEARWESRGNYGVRPLFEMISALTSSTCNPHAIRYDMFYEAASLEAVFKALAKTKGTDAVYIASHGDDHKLNGVSPDDLAAILHRVNNRRTIAGLYIAACSYARMSAVSSLLNPDTSTLQWLAGYRKDVSWLESAAADILFWSGYLSCSAKGPLTKAKRGAENLFRYMPNVVDQLGFGIFKWSNREGRSVQLFTSANG
jgi:hypothetical protein